MNARATLVNVFAVAIALVIAGATQAANISWQYGQNFGGPSGFDAIDVSGTPVSAFNLGVTNGLTVDPGGINLTFASSAQLGGNFTSGGAGSTDASWNTIINETRFNGNNVTLPGFVSGLTPGNDYQVQFFISDQRGCCRNRIEFLHDGNGNNSPSIVQGSFKSLIGRFTADAASQTIGFNAEPGSDPVLNAYVVRDITGVSFAPTTVPLDVGPGDVAINANDGANPLLVVDLVNPTSLSAGEYQATNFNYEFSGGSNIGGVVTPVLVTGGGTDYTVLAQGDPVPFGGVTGGFTTIPFGGDDMFSLPLGGEVFAAFFWQGQGGQASPLGFLNNEGGAFIRFGGGTNAPVVGQPISGGSQGTFARTYDFSVTIDGVAAVPEPASMTLLGVAGLAMLRRRRATRN